MSKPSHDIDISRIQELTKVLEEELTNFFVEHGGRRYAEITAHYDYPGGLAKGKVLQPWGGTTS